MRCRQITFLIASLVLAACADQSASHPALNDQSAATRIETDEGSGAIRFIVNGQEQARIDGAGLHVQQGVDAATLTMRSGPEKAAK